MQHTVWVNVGCFCMECLYFFDEDVTSNELKLILGGKAKISCPKERRKIINEYHEVSVTSIKKKRN